MRITEFTYVMCLICMGYAFTNLSHCNYHIASGLQVEFELVTWIQDPASYLLVV